MSGASTRARRHAVEPLSSRRCHGSASRELPLDGRAARRARVRRSTPRRMVSNSSAIVSGSRAGGAVLLAEDAGLQQRHPALARARAAAGRSGRTGGPGSVLERQPGGAQLGLERARALLVDLLEREAEALGVARGPSPAGRTRATVNGSTSRSRSATASGTSGSSRARSRSSFTPKPMWRCSSCDDVAACPRGSRAAGRARSR